MIIKSVKWILFYTGLLSPNFPLFKATRSRYRCITGSNLDNCKLSILAYKIYKRFTMMKNGSVLLVVVFLLAIGSNTNVLANDPDMLQDLCIADPKSGVTVNGFTCKTTTNISADDFFFAGIAKPAATNNTMGSAVTGAFVTSIPGLNTLGVSMARIDYAPGGLNPPHTHPRATEIVFVLYGELDVGFITTSNVFVPKHIKQGEIFVFPRGLVHFQKNNDMHKPAAVIAGFNSQLPGTQPIAAALFGAKPEVPDNVLTKAFQVGTKQVQKIKSRAAPKK